MPIGNNPDDATPWAANLSFPDLMDLARAIKRDLSDAGHEDKKRDGWKGLLGLRAGNTRTLLHNARFWWSPRSHGQPLPFSCDRSQRHWLKTVILFEIGQIRIMLRDVPMDAQVSALPGQVRFTVFWSWPVQH